MSRDFASRLSALLAATTVAQAIDVISGNFSGLEKDYGKAAEDIFFADPPLLYLAEFAKRYEDDFGRFLDDLDLAKDTLARLPGDDDVPAVSDAWTQPVHLMTALEEIRVFARTEEQLPRARRAARAAGQEALTLTDQPQEDGGRVAIGTMHLAKGLEFKAVAVMACDDGVLPLQSRIEQASDESELDEVYDTERHLLYVACTRARDQVLVTGVEPTSEFLEDLRQLG